MSNTLAAWLMALAAAGLLYLFLRRKNDDDNDGPSVPAPVTPCDCNHAPCCHTQGGQSNPYAPV